MADKKPEKDAETGRFITGNIGGGRSKGSRNKLGEAFIEDVYAKWAEHGAQAIEEMRNADPGGFVRVVAGILPKEMVIKDELSDVSDEELAALILAAREARSNHKDGGDATSAPRRKKQTQGVPTLQ